MNLATSSFLLLGLYALNINIYFYLRQSYDNCKDISFFKMIEEKGLTRHKFIVMYQKLMFNSNFVFIIFGLIGVVLSIFY